MVRPKTEEKLVQGGRLFFQPLLGGNIEKDTTYVVDRTVTIEYRLTS